MIPQSGTTFLPNFALTQSSPLPAPSVEYLSPEEFDSVVQQICAASLKAGYAAVTTRHVLGYFSLGRTSGGEMTWLRFHALDRLHPTMRYLDLEALPSLVITEHDGEDAKILLREFSICSGTLLFLPETPLPMSCRLRLASPPPVFGVASE